MRLRRYALLTLVGAALVIGIGLAFQVYWEGKQSPLNVPKLMFALRAFALDRAAHKQPLPPSVSLKELVAGGYLASSDVSAFQDAEVTFFTGIDGSTPKAVLARAHMPDGSDLVVLADGSVQGSAPERLPGRK